MRGPELRERLRFDLADPLPGDTELPADFFEGPGMAVGQTEPELDDLLLALRQRMEDLTELLLEKDEGRRVHGDHGVGVLDEIAEVRILLLVDRRLQGHRLLGRLLDLPNLLPSDSQFVGRSLSRKELSGGRITHQRDARHLPRDPSLLAGWSRSA